MDEKITARIHSWLTGPYDEETKQEIQKLLFQDPKQLEDAFFKDLSFGTGGMRGLIGVGTNRMNIYTIRATTQGLADYLLSQIKAPSVFIGFDTRHLSARFAEEAARVLAGNGIQVLLSQEICPTPLVSFACRHFRCSAAIMITASHNPPQYNGYKVYWADGGQVVAPHDTGILTAIKQAHSPRLAPIHSSLITQIGRELDTVYLKLLATQQLTPPAPLKIVYSNLHGTGIRLIPEALRSRGYTQIYCVEKQLPLDPDFSHAPSPNPEEEAAMCLGSEQLLSTESDLFIATDPDADRLGVVIREEHLAHRLTGNQIACLCLQHICSSAPLPKNPIFIKTIVTTELFRTIAERFGGTCIDVLTGFKYIAEQIHLLENTPKHFVFGAEESYGALFGTFVRDKDAISMSCLVAEVAAAAKRQGSTLLQELHQLYRTYGVHRELLTTLAFPDSAHGLEQMNQLMRNLRSHPPTHIGSIQIARLEDFLLPDTGLPRSDVLRFWLSDGTKLVIRPSGTEAKIKIYAEVIERNVEDLTTAISSCDARLKDLVHHFTRSCAPRAA